MLFRLALRNILSRKSSAVIVFFIALSLSLMTVINAIFESTEHGVETAYTQSFTGDVLIRSKSNLPLSLFGDETPMTGKLTKIPTLESYLELKNYISESGIAENFVPQVTLQVAMEFEGERESIYAFGVPGHSYISLMPSIHIVEGIPYEDNERGVMISASKAAELGIHVGDEIQFTIQDGITLRIRAAVVAALYEYSIDNAILDNIVLVDPYTVRSLAGMEISTPLPEAIDEDKTDLLSDDFDLFDLFITEEESEPLLFEEDSTVTESEDILISGFGPEFFSQSTIWNYLILRTKENQSSAKIISNLNTFFSKNGWPVEATNWRNAAGSTALYLYWIRLIFNIGVFVILGAGFIVINNTLVVGVLNRTQEIGTLRAEGASRLFISVQCMLETFLLTISSGVLACFIGLFVSAGISFIGISFSNSFLIQLFGSDTLTFSPTLLTFCETIGMSFILGIIGWIYPVMAALKISPVQAMQEVS